MSDVAVSRRRSFFAAAAILVATAGGAGALLGLNLIVDPRYAGVIFITIAEGVLILFASILLSIPIVWVAQGVLSCRLVVMLYLLGVTASVAVAIVATDTVGLSSIFLTIPAIAAAALVASAVGGHRAR